MTQEGWIAKESWTSKHDAFCLAQKLEGAAKLIWQWLVANPNQQKEPDLGQFNKWAAKHRGKPYHRDTLKIAWVKLIDAGVVRPLKKYTWKIWGIILRPITLLVNFPQPRKSSRPGNCDRDQEPSNEQSADDGDVTTTADLLREVPEQLVSELEENITACEEAGICYKPKDAARILACNPEDVKAALALFHKQGGHATHPSPEGWLRKCLAERWWEEPLKPLTLTSVLTFVYKQIRGCR